MSIFVKGGRAAIALGRLSKASKPLARRAALVGGAGLAGSLVSAEAAQPGLKHQAAKEGLLAGVAIGTGLVLSPKLARAAFRGAKRSARAAKVGLKRKGRLTFRRIRGRLVPIRVKK